MRKEPNSRTFALTHFLLPPAVSQLSSLMLNGGLGLGGAPGLNLSVNLNNPIVGPNQSLTSQLLDQVKMILRSSGCSEHVTAEISTAMATLAK